MKTHYLFFLFLFIIAFGCFSCEKQGVIDDNKETGNKTETPPDSSDIDKGNYPIDIPIADFTWSGCTWNHIKSDEVAIINSYEELTNYLTCSDGGSFPEVDFSKHTLLYVYVGTTDAPCYIFKNLQQISKNNYNLNVEINLLNENESREWGIVFITDKFNEKSNIKLNLTTTFLNETEHSVWKYIGPYDFTVLYDSSLVIEMSFYPSIHKIYIQRNYETLGSPHLLIWRGVYDYCIIPRTFPYSTEMYMKSPFISEYNFNSYNSWVIEFLSENELLLRYGGIVLEPPMRIKLYRFICQSNFKGI